MSACACFAMASTKRGCPWPREVTAIQSAKASVVEAQLDAVFASLPVSAVKTGMLFSRPIIDAVAKRLAKRRGLQLVIDPVMISSSGTPLLKPTAEAALNKRLLPLAKLVTPNLDEAAALATSAAGGGMPARHGGSADGGDAGDGGARAQAVDHI